MIKFNVLGIYNDHLVIDVSVLDESYYANVYLDSIVIDTQDTYSAAGPSSNPVYEYTIPDSVSKLTKQSTSNKHYRLELDANDLGSLDNLFFVYVRTKGTPAPDTPCGMDNNITLSAVLNMLPFYTQSMQYTKTLANNCASHREYANYILKFKALEYAIKTGNYTQAIEYFNSFFKGKTTVQTGGCGCGNH